MAENSNTWKFTLRDISFFLSSLIALAVVVGGMGRILSREHEIDSHSVQLGHVVEQVNKCLSNQKVLTQRIKQLEHSLNKIENRVFR